MPKPPSPTAPVPVPQANNDYIQTENSNDESTGDELITLPISKIETLLDLFGEQVILLSLLGNIKENLDSNTDQAKKTIDQLSKITYQLQNATMALRMVSLHSFFIKMQRTVRDTSIQIDKKIILEVKGEDTELDKHMVDKLSGFATHLVRNSIDHGIETPDERVAAGKTPEGHITINAYIHGGFFYFETVDDGKGIIRKNVRAKAIKVGLIKETDELTDQETVNLIFKPGFSTKDQASEISGRGFGMDIVQHEVSRMHGSVNIESIEHKSTRIIVRLPLTMAIFNGIVVRIQNSRFIIPSSEVQDISRIPLEKCIPINDKEIMVELKDRVMPLIPICKAIKIACGTNTDQLSLRKMIDNKTEALGVALEVMHQNKPFALRVDELIGLQRVVLKNLGKEIRNCPGISGGAVLSDGSVALVIETDKVIDLYEKSFR